MVTTLFRIYIKDSSFALWKFCSVLEHLFICQRCCYKSGQVERFLAFGLTCRCTEVSECGNSGFIYPDYLWRKRISICGLYECIVENLWKFMLMILHSLFFFFNLFHVTYFSCLSIISTIFTYFTFDIFIEIMHMSRRPIRHESVRYDLSMPKSILLQR